MQDKEKQGRTQAENEYQALIKVLKDFYMLAPVGRYVEVNNTLFLSYLWQVVVSKEPYNLEHVHDLYYLTAKQNELLVNLKELWDRMDGLSNVENVLV